MFPQPIGEALFDLQILKKADIRGVNLQKPLDDLEHIPDGRYQVLEMDEKRVLLFPNFRRGGYLLLKRELTCALHNKYIRGTYAKELRENTRYRIRIRIRRELNMPGRVADRTETLEFMGPSQAQALQQAKRHYNIVTGKNLPWKGSGKIWAALDWPNEYVIESVYIYH